MKNLALLIAVATMLTSTLGCNACRNLFGGNAHVVARPVARCGPSCGPACNSCGSSAPTSFQGSYNGGAPTETYMGSGDFSNMPVMMTAPAEIPAG